MEKKIEWETDMEAALARAQSENSHVLLDFFDPGWIGCQQMDAVSYPDLRVVEFVSNNMIPLRVPADAKPLSDDFNVKWTPTIVTLDSEGKEHHRTVGFLPPDELIPSLLLGIGKSCFENEQFDDAMATLQKLMKDYPDSDSAPEGLYLLAVCRYKSSHDAKPLKEGYEQLKAKYPSSEWTKRAYPYRLL